MASRPVSPLALLVASTFFMEFLDGTIVTTALPRMAASLGTDAVDLHVGITAYLLTVAVFILPGGWAASRFGARGVFMGAIAVFTAGSALCAMADSVGTFVAARIVQGVGGAMMVPVGRLAVLRTTEKADLMRAVAVITWPGLTAPLLGPPLGGYISEHFSWRWIFLVNLPLGLLGFVLARYLVPALRGTLRVPFDGLGFALGAMLLLSATEALDMLGHDQASVPAIMSLAVVASIAGALLWRHVQRHQHPLLDPAPFRVATFRIVMIGGTTMRVLISAMPFLLPLLFQLGFGWDPFESGLLVLTLFAGNVAIKPLTSPVLRRWGFRTVMVINGLVQAATMLACVALTPRTPIMAIIPLLVVSGASRSLQFTALGTLAFADVPKPSMGGANTLFSVAFQLAIGLGVAVGAVTLRAAGWLLGPAGAGGNDLAPSLAAFHVAFGMLAVLMAASALAGLRLARDAGSVVSGQAGRSA